MRCFRSSQKNQARAAKLRSIETEFYKYVDAEKTATFLDIDFETTEAMFYYWKLKRRVSRSKRKKLLYNLQYFLSYMTLYYISQRQSCYCMYHKIIHWSIWTFKMTLDIVKWNLYTHFFIGKKVYLVSNFYHPVYDYLAKSLSGTALVDCCSIRFSIGCSESSICLFEPIF